MTATEEDNCPVCGRVCNRILSIPSPAIIIEHKRLRYGSGAPGKLITQEETGGMGILVPSFGAMEKEEVDYVAGMALKKEKDRQKKKETRVQQQIVQAYSDLAYQTPQGQRAKTIKKAMKQEVGEV